MDSSWSSLAGSGDGGGLSEGNAALGGGTTCFGAVDFDAQNRPYVVWQQWDGALQPTYLKLWDGSSWVGLGGSASGDGLTAAPGYSTWWPSVIVDASGNPWVAYTSGSNAYVQRWDGISAWVGVDGSDVFPGLIGIDGMAVFVTVARGSDGSVFAARTQHGSSLLELHVASTDGTTWSPMGGIIGTTSSEQAGPVLATGGGTLFVSWSDGDDPVGRLHVARFVVGTWQELPVATPSGGPQTGMAVDSRGNPVVVWAGDDGARRRVHGARWGGSAWVSIDGETGSISTTVGDATWPQVALTPNDDIVVVWLQDLGAGVFEVYGLRLDAR